MKTIFFTALGIIAGAAATAFYHQMVLLPWGLECIYLIVSGGLGGLAYSISSRGNLLSLPHWVFDPQLGIDRRSWDVGFVGDVFIGMLGAAASLVFGLALLNPTFFGAVQGKQADFVIPSWARIMAFGALTGFASRQLLPGLSRRLSQIISEEVKDRVAQSEKKTNDNLELAKAQAEAARLAAKVANPPVGAAAAIAAVQPQVAALVAAQPNPQPQWVYEMEQLVTQYEAITILDYDRRIAERMRIADSMLTVLTTNNVLSDGLLAQVRTHPSSVWVLPLATLIGASPETGDASRLCDACELRLNDAAVRENSRFVLYRVLLAITALESEHLILGADRARAKNIARNCLNIDDVSLRKRASAVVSLFN